MASPELALRAAYAAQVRAVRRRVLTFVAATWFALGSWRDQDIEDFVALIVPMVVGGQRSISSLTVAYLAQLAQLQFGGRLRPATVAPEQVTVEALRGVPAVEVYTRPGATVWTELAGGRGVPEAVLRGGDRALEVAATDLQLAKTHTAREVLRQDKRQPTGWRRVLEGDTSCGLCALAATQRYTIEDLMPIHPGCDCSVAPLYGWNDRILDPGEVDRIHQLAKDFFGDGVDTFAASAGSHTTRREYDFRDLVVVHEHGELGPVLAEKGHGFTGPSKLRPREPRAPRGPVKYDSTDLQISQLRDRIPRLEERVAAGDTTAAAPLEFSRRRLAELTTAAA